MMTMATFLNSMCIRQIMRSSITLTKIKSKVEFINLYYMEVKKE